MRLMECIRLRVKDIEFSRNEIVIRDGKGGKDRITMLPSNQGQIHINSSDADSDTAL